LPSLTGKGDLILMAKKQVAEKELEAKTAELQGADARLAEKETIESEADSVSIEQIKSS
jgi:small subunit ribosomal protein S1